MTGERLVLETVDGATLAAMLYRPQAMPRHVVLMAGALAVGQSHYAPFAQWLAGRGHLAMTFDPRGIGASRIAAHARSLRGLDADLLTWAHRDFAAALTRLCEVANRPQVAVVGHSLGAHHAAMTGAAAQEKIARLVSVAAGSGYWRDWAAPSRRFAPLMLRVAIPFSVATLGYFAGSRLKMVGDLPAGVARQWSRWCLHPEFAWGAEPERVMPALCNARFPIHAFCFTDDEAMTETCTRKLMGALPQAPSVVEAIDPSQLGLPRVGHLGAFRRTAGAVLWPMIERRFD